ncbi:putative NADP(+)-dependent dehydrogenase [Aspergillus heteromorphus CBS 117.55]|uniref:Putative NADP(+)-dependent dehydrogenase n=1 Tax=Aspergillus heteromorphus CBS 117.55 TaxID=1448321 RepID=A0A317WIH7_9EURO|nr:putative NADP(+)-dependent dehydrogenase [Aspergillus heteromorphus CBS 117.55]PWY84977.1 putative NADP(+)-dependent dehydrogenase [Aspergillus heteromorphus CBS 117.55]
MPPLPSLTPTWHNTTYPSISPTRPDLSAANRTIIITGAGSGIGRATALSFSRAGAHKIILIGRTLSTLIETQSALSCPSSVHACSVTDEASLATLASEIGPWDVLILGAGYLAGPATIRDSGAEDWWGSFEVFIPSFFLHPSLKSLPTHGERRIRQSRGLITVSWFGQTNVKGAYLPIKTLLPTARPQHATIIAITAITTFPATALPGLSAYVGSKLALHKVIEFVAAENPNVFAAALHPGMVETGVFRKSGGDKERLPMDDVSLPADFMVWLASPEAAFLNGRQVWANWDVEELKLRRGRIGGGLELTAGVYGWPFRSGL